MTALLPMDALLHCDVHHTLPEFIGLAYYSLILVLIIFPLMTKYDRRLFLLHVLDDSALHREVQP